MIKLLHPLTGDFSGFGTLPDGTECVAHFEGTEIIQGCCFGMRFELRVRDNHNPLMNAYMTMSEVQGGDDLVMALYETRDSCLEMRREATSAEDDGRHRHSFVGLRRAGGLIRVGLEIVSASEFRLSLAVAPRAGDTPLFNELWCLEMLRNVEMVSIGKAA
jgi:hypothetical protein